MLEELVCTIFFFTVRNSINSLIYERKGLLMSLENIRSLFLNKFQYYEFKRDFQLSV